MTKETSGGMTVANAALSDRFMGRFAQFGNASDFLAAIGSSEKYDAVQFLKSVMGKVATVDRVADLPPWDSILNDKGGLISTGVDRPKDCAVLAHQATKRCFFLVVGDAQADRDLEWNIALKNYIPHGTIRVDRQLYDLIFQQWDEGKGEDVEAKSETELQAKFDAIGLAAVMRNASDIHITWRKTAAKVLFRIHGELQHYRDMSVQECRDMVRCAYNTLSEEGSTKSGFNENSMQDGIIERDLSGVRVRFRYSGLPIALGYDVTLRVIVMGEEASIRPSHLIGYAPEQHAQIKRAISKSSGVVLFVGATGSGKSSSMASFLKEKAIEEPGKKLRSVEEPVETLIPGVAQTAVKRINDDNSDFQDVLRQLLRSDPDVMMIGEIRDQLTAEMAFQASLTGHLILTTLHVKNALLAFERLVGMGCKRAEIATVGLINCVVFQTLLPALCPHCKVRGDSFGGDTRGVEERLEHIGLTISEVYFKSGTGCDHCNHSGISGREVCAEVVTVTENLLRYVREGDSVGLREAWRSTRKGGDDMTGCTAFEHAVLKMKQGLVSPLSIESGFQMIDEGEAA